MRVTGLREPWKERVLCDMQTVTFMRLAIIIFILFVSCYTYRQRCIQGGDFHHDPDISKVFLRLSVSGQVEGGPERGDG